MPDPTIVDILKGTPYRPTRFLGEGAMGFVVEAEHIALRKRVVVKLLHERLTLRPDLVQRLRVEAQSLGALAHPHIVMVTDFAQTPGGRPYFVMERLEGRPLAEELLERGHLPIPEAIEYVRQLLSALSAAHAAGIIHRDIKAENIFLCAGKESGARSIKLLDFGVAKVRPELASSMGPAQVQFVTEEGAVIGTPRWVAPEQARGRAIDARVDIYAVGNLLYALIAGQGPFSHVRGVQNLLAAHLDEIPRPPSSIAPQPVPSDLDAAVLKALEKRPEDRYQSAEAFSEALASLSPPSSDGPEWAKTEPIDAPPGGGDLSGCASGPRRKTDPDAGVTTVSATPWALLPKPSHRARVSEFQAFLLVTLVSTIIFGAIVALALAHIAGRG